MREGLPAHDPAPNSAMRIQVLRPRLPAAERLLSYLRRIDEGRSYTNWGPLASELEQRLAAHLRVPSASVTLASSGTAALAGGILAAAGRATQARSLAVVPAFTFVATALSVEQCGFQPHIVDVDARSWMLTPEALEGHPRLNEVGLVVPVAPFGLAVPQAPWREFRRRTGIPVVIDGGASFEATGREPGRYLGPIPVALSFHATKSYSTAEGGGVVTTDPDLAHQVGAALNFGFAGTRECQGAATNGKLSEYHAAIGHAELDGWVEKQSSLLQVAEAYRTAMKSTGLHDRLIAAPAIASCYVLFLCPDVAEATEVLRAMEDADIESRLWYGTGLHSQRHFAGCSRDAVPVTDGLAPRLIALPVAPDLSEAEIGRVVTAVAAGVERSRSSVSAALVPPR